MQTPLVLSVLARTSVMLLAPIAGIDASESFSVNPIEARAFDEADRSDWDTVFHDSCTADWKSRWFLDGEVGTIENGPEGMVLRAGPEFGNDAHHMVLWTRESFEGDLKIEYTYTRLDEETRAVTILYIQASGSGIGPHEEDIAAWSDLRRTPAMRAYYDNMHLYHISLAAFPNDADTTSYIRARRYVPDGRGIEGTGLVPDYYPNGLFETGVPHRVTVIKRDRDLYLRIENASQAYYCHMRNADLPPVISGRIGLRHMYTRTARYADFSISYPR